MNYLCYTTNLVLLFKFGLFFLNSSTKWLPNDSYPVHLKH